MNNLDLKNESHYSDANTDEKTSKLLEEVLENGEECVKVIKPSTLKLFIGSCLKWLFEYIIAFAVVLGIAVPNSESISLSIWLTFGIIFVVCFSYSLINSLLRYNKTRYVLTNKRIIIRTGYIASYFKTLNIRMISTIDYHESIVDKICRTGSIYFSSPSNVQNPENMAYVRICFYNIKNPLETYKFFKDFISRTKELPKEDFISENLNSSETANNTSVQSIVGGKNFFENVISEDEKILKILKPKRSVMFLQHSWPVLLSIPFISLFIGALGSMIGATTKNGVNYANIPNLFIFWAASAVLLFAVVVIWCLVLHKNTYYAITDKRIITRRGVISINYQTTELKSIGTIFVKSSFFDKIIGKDCGSVYVGSSSNPIQGLEKDIILSNIETPYDVMHEISNLSQLQKLNSAEQKEEI